MSEPPTDTESSQDPVDPTGALGELSNALLSSKDMEAVLADVVALTQRHLPGADQCSITLIRGKRASTVASTGRLATEVDEVQYDQGYGPCLDAGRSNIVMHIPDMATETRWPRYTPAARELGVGSSLSMPLPVENYLVGALNTYATRAHAFTADSIAIGTTLAAHITTALSFAESSHGHRLRAENLDKAMRSRDIIEQAKGMIMARQKCSAEAAFELLRRLSMNQNVKLQDLAVSLVSSGSGQSVRLPVND